MRLFVFSGLSLLWLPVIPVKTGIHLFGTGLDSRFHGNDKGSVSGHFCNIRVLIQALSLIFHLVHSFDVMSPRHGCRQFSHNLCEKFRGIEQCIKPPHLLMPLVIVNNALFTPKKFDIETK